MVYLLLHKEETEVSEAGPKRGILHFIGNYRFVQKILEKFPDLIWFADAWMSKLCHYIGYQQRKQYFQKCSRNKVIDLLPFLSLCNEAFLVHKIFSQ